MYEEEFIGAIKIKDGLFIGDEASVRDLEFIITNKVTHVINAAGKQLDNLLENLGIQYLTFYWQESDKQILFEDMQGVEMIVQFIEEASSKGESCLVHSVRGQSRACCVLTAYFMRKYQWTLLKTLDYLNSRRSDLEIRATFFDQLKHLEFYLQETNQGAISADWKRISQPSDATHPIENHPEEILLRNTYINSKPGPIPEYYINMTRQQQQQIAGINGIPMIQGGKQQAIQISPGRGSNSRLSWIDEATENKKKLVQVLNQNNASAKKGVSVQHRKPSPAPFKRTHQQQSTGTNTTSNSNSNNNTTTAGNVGVGNNQLKSSDQQEQGQQITDGKSNKQDYVDSILKGSNKTFKKNTGQIVVIQDTQTTAGVSTSTASNNAAAGSNVSQTQQSDQLQDKQQQQIKHSISQPQADSGNNNTNVIAVRASSLRSSNDKQEPSRQAIPANMIIPQNKNLTPPRIMDSQQPFNKQAAVSAAAQTGKGAVVVINSNSNNRPSSSNSSSNNNDKSSTIRGTSNTSSNNNTNSNNTTNKVSNINGNIINLTVNNYVNAGGSAGTQQAFTVSNLTGQVVNNSNTTGIVTNVQNAGLNSNNNNTNYSGQPLLLPYPQQPLDFIASFAKLNPNNNNSALLPKTIKQQQQQQYSSDPVSSNNNNASGRVLSTYKSVLEESNSKKKQTNAALLPQPSAFPSEQIMYLQKLPSTQQQQFNSTQQQQPQEKQLQSQPQPIQQQQSQQPSSQSNVASNSSTLQKMLSKGNPYHHSDSAYQKAISKSFNSSKIKQDHLMLFPNNQGQLTMLPNSKEAMNSFSFVKADLSDAKITRHMHKVKQPGQQQEQKDINSQPVVLKYSHPLKPGSDLIDQRPNSATIPSRPRQTNNGYPGQNNALSNNFLMMNYFPEDQQQQAGLNNNNGNDGNTANKRPSSTGGGVGLRQFSPSIKNVKVVPTNSNSSNAMQALKTQLIVTNYGGGKKSTMRYPSPLINSSTGGYQSGSGSASKNGKWK